MFKDIKQLSNMEDLSFIRVTNVMKTLKYAHLSNLTHDNKEKRECKVKQEVSRVKKKNNLNDSFIESTLLSLEKSICFRDEAASGTLEEGYEEKSEAVVETW